MKNDDVLYVYDTGLGRDLYEIFFYSEENRLLFKKMLMKYIKISTYYKKYKMEIHHVKRRYGTVPTYFIRLKKHSGSSYTKNLIRINENGIFNLGNRIWDDKVKSGIKVDFDLKDFCMKFIREYKTNSLLYEE